MTLTFESPLVETDWLEAKLEDPTLRVLDCTVNLQRSDGETRVESGREAWAAEHIPRSVYADLAGELSDRSSKLRFMMPPVGQFAQAMGRLGVGDGTSVVLYDRAGHMWAARIWWMLRAAGFDDAAVLNGGWMKWTAEGRPVANATDAYSPASFTPRPRPELFADRDEVLASIDDGAACILNALGEEQHRGEVSGYGRAGHIASSVNVPAASLVDPETNAYRPTEELRASFANVGATSGDRVITYCGGGIAASSDAFVLHLLGVPNVAVYDGSLSEWAADPTLPLEVG